MNLLTVRCSSLPIVCRCPAATMAPALTIEGDDAPARLGSGVHEVLSQWIPAGRADETQAVLAAGKWDCDPNEAVRLSWQGWNAWGKLSRHFPAPECERSLEIVHPSGVMLTGHPDVLSITEDGDCVYLLDWKTGHNDGDHADQMRGYALLALSAAPAAVKAMVALVRLREGTVEWLQFDRVSLFLWWTRTVESLAEKEFYRPGPHCQYCPRAHECNARKQLLGNAIETIGGTVMGFPEDAPKMLAKRLADVLDRVKLIEGACSLAKEQIKAEVARRGGRVDTGDGRELVLVPNRRRELDAERAWPVLMEDFAVSDLLPLVGLSVGDVEKLVMKDAERGQKSAAAKWYMNKLAQVGAIVEKTLSPRLEVKQHGNSNAALAADDQPAALATKAD